MPIARAKDQNKDQTYFIWQIKKVQIPKILFPVGDFEDKSKVREYAESRGLITSSKPDSQGLCFVGQTSLREMLLSVLGKKVGDILVYLSEEQIVQIGLKVTKKNNIESKDGVKKIRLGKHEGAFLFTIGQRQNLGLSNGPWFVQEVDVINNEVVVCHTFFQKAIEVKQIKISNINWQINFEDIIGLVYTKSEKLFQVNLESQIRYRNSAHNSVLEFDSINNSGVLTFDNAIKAVAKGQSVVFYCGKILLGGGVIQEIIDYA
jgi:tRNA-uridine 2-sulfurtransferase